jgi:hypothetical protein
MSAGLMEKATVATAERSGLVDEAPYFASLSAMKARQNAKLREIRETLVAAGLVSLDQQAAALGLRRSTAWVVLKANHKASGISGTIIKDMLTCPRLPTSARQVIEHYVARKLAGDYGHSQTSIRKFRARLGPVAPRNAHGFATMVEIALSRNGLTDASSSAGQNRPLAADNFRSPSPE